jgi:hypothetical protein
MDGANGLQQTTLNVNVFTASTRDECPSCFR